MKLLHRFLNNNILIYVCVSLGLFILMGSRDFLLLFMGLDFNAVINIPTMIWEENYVYFNWINRIDFDSAKYFSVLMHGFINILFQYICMGNQIIFYILVHTVFPILSFWFIYRIYCCYINRTWALCLAFLGIVYLKHFSMWDSIKLMLASPLQYFQTGPVALFEISRLVYPSISFLFFIATLYFSTRHKKLTYKQIISYSIIWGAQIYIYPMNWVAGSLFWILYIPIHSYFAKYSIKTVIKYLVMTFFCVGIITLPYFKQVFSQIMTLDLYSEWMHRYSNVFVNQWGVGFAYLVPIVFMFLVILFRCADYYELIYRFYPIFILMFVELICLNIHWFLPIKDSTMYIFSDRIGNFFCRFLYFVPIFYFMSISPKRFYHENTIKAYFFKLFDKLLNQIHFLRHRLIICLTGVVILMLFATQVRYLIFLKSQKSQRVFSDSSQVVQLLHAIKSNIIVNQSSKEKLSAIARFCKYNGWAYSDFSKLMTPNKFSKEYNRTNGYIVTEEKLRNGFGYWAVFQTKEMNMKYYRQYIDLLKQVWESI